jgi:predicted RNA-binding Zn ribbon-like protein
VDLLTCEDCARVRQCESEGGCGWIYLDNTKGRTRRWCSMRACGNRAKARRHYARVKAES